MSKHVADPDREREPGAQAGPRSAGPAEHAFGYPGRGASHGAVGSYPAVPGKRTLVESAYAPVARAHAPAPIRVADATHEHDRARPNALLKVVVLEGGRVIQTWQSRARWEGSLPERYTATRAGRGWRWDNTGGPSVRVGTSARGDGGEPVEAWARVSADRIVVYAQPLDAVTVDAKAPVDANAPGHARRAQDAGDGSTAAVEPAGTASRDDEAWAPGAADAKLVDDFERELGIQVGVDAEGEAGAGEAGAGEAGAGEAGGDPAGRTGADTRVGAAGPGGEQARPDGTGAGSRDGRGPDGSAGGSRDGAQGGAAEGMYGGTGAHGDLGVPSAIGLFGGLISVPVALRGFVEVALILSSGDLTGAGASLFRKGLGKIASAAAARRMIAQEARVAALTETTAVIKRIATDGRTAKAWAVATAEEQMRAMRIIYWELQRRFFKGYLAAARRAKAQILAALQKAPRSAALQRSLEAAEMAEEAATVQPIAGRLPRNHQFAGKQVPSDRLPAGYRKKGVRFSEIGYPDFEPHAMTLPDGRKYVEIKFTGSRRSDIAAANAKCRFPRTPLDYTWHHGEDMKKMYLIPSELHKELKHTGGVAEYTHRTGQVPYGK